jgi:Fic family protein
MPAGRPSLDHVLKRLTETNLALRQQLGGLPSSIQAGEIWKDIWLEETHHSTAIEGNTLTPRELYQLVEHGIATGSKELVHYLEVQGYAQAAKWIYEQAVQDAQESTDPWRFFSVQHVRQIHAELIGLVWSVRPPVGSIRPGDWRQGMVTIAGSPVKPVPPGMIDSLMDQWVQSVKEGPLSYHPVEWAARLHADFEIIHPFPDGNGRTGRLVMNYLLILNGYSPAIIYKAQRSRYIAALQRAQVQKEYRGLVELVARAVLDNLNRLLLPQLASDETWLPLSALAEGTPYTSDYLRKLADQGKLKALKQAGHWVSTKRYVEAYMEAKSSRGRKPVVGDQQGR